MNQRHLTPAGRVGTLYSPRPNPCDDRCLAAALLPGHLHLGVEMTDALVCLLLHPLAIIAHILCQALRSAPSLRHLTGSGIRVYGSHAGKPGRNLYHGLVNHHSHRVQVMGVGFQPQPLRLQRNRTATGKGVQQFRGIPAC